MLLAGIAARGWLLAQRLLAAAQRLHTGAPAAELGEAPYGSMMLLRMA
jgi:hypothetical protein